MQQGNEKKLFDSNPMKIIRWIIFVPVSLLAYMFAYFIYNISFAFVSSDQNQSGSITDFLLLLIFTIFATFSFINVGMKISVDKKYSIEVLYNIIIVTSVFGAYWHATDKKYLLSVPFVIQLAVAYFLYKHFKKKHAS